jgi:ADP-ribose diphosphatase
MGKKAKSSQVVSSREAYRGPVFWVTTDYVQEPGGVQARRDIVRHQGSVVILAVDDSNSEPGVLLERQYRHAAQGHLWELPAGRIDDGESEMAAARRELLEETGYAAREWKRVLKFYASPGFLDETMALYMAMGLRPGKAQPEEDEVIHARLVPLSEAISMVGRGAIKDAKTITGILWFDRFVHGPKVRKQRVSRVRVT